MEGTIIGPLERRPKILKSAILTTDPFLDTILTNFNSTKPADPFNIRLGLTENSRDTYLETRRDLGSRCLDHLKPNLQPSSSPEPTPMSRLTEVGRHCQQQRDNNDGGYATNL